MGYYADVDGYINFKRPLSTLEYDYLGSILSEEYEYDGRDLADVSFWSRDKYHSDITEDILDRICKKFPVKEGEVECHGEDGEHWHFKYVGGPNTGKFFRYSVHVVYDDEMPVGMYDRMEFVGQLIDVFEDFLDKKQIIIPNEEKAEDGSAANIYGTDYGMIQSEIEEILSRWHII